MAQQKFVDSKGRTVDFLFFDSKTLVFKVIKRFGKKIKKRSLGKISESKAKSLVLSTLIELKVEHEAEERQRLLREKKNSQPQNKLLKDFIEELESIKITEGLRPTTIARFRNVKNKWLIPFCGNYAPEDISHEIRQDLILWRDKNRPGLQLFNVFKYLDETLNLMINKGVILSSQKPKLDPPKAEKEHHKKKKGRVVSVNEILAIIENSTPDMALIAKIAYIHGMRKMEILRINRGSAKKVDGKLVFALDTDDTKTGIARVIPVHPSIVEEVEARLKENHWLFPSPLIKKHISSHTIEKAWASAKIQAKIKGSLRFHDLRGTCATNMATRNINPILACSLLGMSLKVYQDKYLKLTAKDLIIAVEATPLFSSSSSIEKG